MATSDGKTVPKALPDSAEAIQLTPSTDWPPTDCPRKLQPPEAIRRWTAEERQHHEKKLLRKIDMRILPMIVIMYILNYLDR